MRGLVIVSLLAIVIPAAVVHAQLEPFGVSMSWQGRCATGNGSSATDQVSGSSGPLVGQTSYVLAAQTVTCELCGGTPPICVGSDWTGSGAVELGKLEAATDASAAAAFLPDAQGDGRVTGAWGDTLHVQSASLPAGTPVKLRFELALASDGRITPLGGQPCPPSSFFSPVLVTATFAAPASAATSGGSATLQNVCEGPLVASVPFIVTAPVGSDVAIGGRLETSTVALAMPEFFEHTTASSSGRIDGSETSHFYVDAITPGATYTTASGTSYTSPTPPSPCGNGILDAGESCDDGNLAPNDCCSPGCAPEPAGTSCRPAARGCDAAESCDGVSAVCPADQALPDGDDDGICDVEDACDNTGGAHDFLSGPGAELRLGNLGRAAGTHTIRLRAEIELPAGTSFADLDPVATGVRLRLSSADGLKRIDRVLPGQSVGASWARRANGRAWVWRGPGGSRLQLTAHGDPTTRRLRVTFRERQATYPFAAGDLPLEVAIVFGTPPPDVPCAESAFAGGACKVDPRATTLVCNQ